MLDELIELAEQQARLVILGLQMDLVPSWLLINQNKEVHIFGTPFHSRTEKMLAAAYIRERIRQHKAVAYSFLSEAWMVTRPLEEITEGFSPRDEPDRREMVMAFATDGTEKRWKRWWLIRDWEGKPERFEELAQDDFNQPEGWTTQMLA